MPSLDLISEVGMKVSKILDLLLRLTLNPIVALSPLTLLVLEVDVESCRTDEGEDRHRRTHVDLASIAVVRRVFRRVCPDTVGKVFRSV